VTEFGDDQVDTAEAIKDEVSTLHLDIMQEVEKVLALGATGDKTAIVNHMLSSAGLDDIFGQPTLVAKILESNPAFKVIKGVDAFVDKGVELTLEDVSICIHRR